MVAQLHQRDVVVGHLEQVAPLELVAREVVQRPRLELVPGGVEALDQAGRQVLVEDLNVDLVGEGREKLFKS